MTLLAARTGIFDAIILFLKGIARGEPAYIAIAVLIVLVLGGLGFYKYFKAK